MALQLGGEASGMVQRTQPNVICRRVKPKPPGGQAVENPLGVGGYQFNCFGGERLWRDFVCKKKQGMRIERMFSKMARWQGAGSKNMYK